ncbi:MAG: glycoside hydrolase family 16 protein, partial [Chitinophagia bacterium]|nr:glycoside hydrolase family 16 protein [Chitinophagia bacterium]
QNFGNNGYTSAKLVTKNKGDWMYGRFEARMKIPTGRGTWPAFWMLPTDASYGGWPKSGEVDIMEHVGYDQDKIYVTVHTDAFNHLKNTQYGRDTLVRGATENFNIYRVDWTPTSITGYVNNNKMFQFNNSNKGYQEWPFDKRFYLLLNLAVGGDWGGRQGIDDSAFPTTLEIDYVRVYQYLPK